MSQILLYCRCENPDYDYKDASPETMEIVPVNFGTEHKQMLCHLYLMVNEALLAIPDKYEKIDNIIKNRANKRLLIR